MWPSFITAIECDSASASLWSWVTYTVVIRSSRCRRFSSKRMRSRSFASRLESGSSSRSSCGSITSARASARRCCWPPESLVASRSASSSSCTALRTRRTLSRISFLENLRSPTSSGKAAFWKTFMCGQMAYDWNTMPKPRRLGATKTFRVEEYTTRSPTLISPARGRSRPAIERSVVVLPQPLGPSRVNSFPSGTSNVTSCAARTIWPRSLGYSVKSPSTFSTRFSGSLLDSEFPAQPLGQHHQNEEREDEKHAERRQLHVLAVLPQLPDGDRQDFGAGAVEQDRAGELADRDDHHVDPARDEPGLEQGEDDAAKRRAPGGAAHRRRFLELLVDLQHRGRVVPQAVGHETGDVGDEHDPDRAVHADVEIQVEDHDRKAQHQPGEDHRQRSDVVEEPASGQFCLDDDPADDRGHQHDHRRAAEGKDQRVPHRAREVRIGEDEAVGVEGEVVQGLPGGHRIEPLERGPQQHREGQHYDQEEVHDEDRGGEPAPGSEVDSPRPEALAGHGRVLAAAARQARHEVHTDGRDHEQGHPVSGGET